MIELREMTAADYVDFLGLVIPAYAESNVTSGRWSKKDALEKSRQSFAELLPQGLQTPEHLLFVITPSGSLGKVG